jgi:hypothetical protein
VVLFPRILPVHTKQTPPVKIPESHIAIYFLQV